MKRRLLAVLTMTAVFAGCAGSSTSIPSVGVQKPALTAETTGVTLASSIYVADAGAMKILPVGSNGAAAFTSVSMPSSFAANGGADIGQFAAMNIGGNRYIAYVNAIPPAQNVQPELTVCQIVVETINVHGKIEKRDVCNAVSVLGSALLNNPNGGVEVVWDNADQTLATLNRSNNAIAMFAYGGGDTLAMVSSTTFSAATDGYIAMAADPLTGGLWFLTAASYSPYLMSFDAATGSFGSPQLRTTLTIDGPPRAPTALDVNNNYDLWVGNTYGSVYSNDNGTEQIYAAGVSCGDVVSIANPPGSQLPNVVAIGSDTQNGYIASSTMIDVYSDGASQGTGLCGPSPARQITGFSNIEGMTVL